MNSMHWLSRPNRLNKLAAAEQGGWNEICFTLYIASFSFIIQVKHNE